MQRAARPQRQAPAAQRAATPQRQAPAANRAAQRQERIQQRAQRQTPAAKPNTPAAAAQVKQQAQQNARPLSAAQTRQQQRAERALQQRENRALRALPPQQRAARRQELQQQRTQRAQQRLQPNATVQSRALNNNAQAAGPRRNGQARVTQQASRQGRFASAFASARHSNPGVNANAGRSRSGHFAARQAWRQGLRAAFVPWFGPVFYPYAYSDIFDYTFWPAGYDDGYYAYAYDDFFDGVFYGEQGPPPEYVEGYDEATPAAPRAAAAPAPSYAAVQQLCAQPGNGVTVWPFAEIQQKVGLNDEQKQLLNDVKSAGQKAAGGFKASCPSENAFPLTPPGRLNAMLSRLDATLEAVETVKPTLEKFYDSLSDEQKERFNQIGPKQQETTGQAAQASAAETNSCKDQKPGLANLPIEKIEDAVKPTDAQIDDLNRLERPPAKQCRSCRPRARMTCR
ncbi:MAG: Spy/CpxP family protein refolding chaperone [Pseudolabrys sp.]